MITKQMTVSFDIPEDVSFALTEAPVEVNVSLYGTTGFYFTPRDHCVKSLKGTLTKGSRVSSN